MNLKYHRSHKMKRKNENDDRFKRGVRLHMCSYCRKTYEISIYDFELCITRSYYCSQKCYDIYKNPENLSSKILKDKEIISKDK